jgi:2'-hydroxyisoflavone reductase
MTTRLLVLGGSGFVGRAFVLEGLDRGWEVTTFNRGHRPVADPRVQTVSGDRLRSEDLWPLRGGRWDLVADTWSGAPRAVRDSAAALARRADAYVYVSSCSVYRPPLPMGLAEATPTVDAAADAEAGDYAELKRGSELAAVAAFGERALLLRPGLILGPHEDVGRLPWWLYRMARGGDVLAPGPAELPLQYIDARDLARFALDAGMDGVSGPINTVSRRGHTTMGELLETCRELAGAPDTQLRWLPAETVLAAGIEPWMDLPVWIPPGHEFEAMHGADVELALRAGLRCRPVQDTVADTWAWLAALDGSPPGRADLPPLGLDRELERRVLADHHLTRETSRPG